MSTTVVYQTGMDIGMTVDMNNFSCCQNIFSAEEKAKTSTVERHNNTVKYSVIKKSSDVGKMIGLSGEMSLKAKAGLISVGGLGSFFEEDHSEDNVTEIIATAQVETVTVSLDSEATPKAGWTARVHGTHYIRSITYGGDLFARIRIKSSDAQHKEDIKASVEGLGSYGIIDGEVKGQFKTMAQNISNFSEIQIEYFSTTEKSEMPKNIDGMVQALDTFKTEVAKLNDNKGVPCRCEIIPLHYLDLSFPAHVKEGAFTSVISSLEEKFDDVQVAKKKLNFFLEGTEDDLDPDSEKDAFDLEKRIDKAHRCLLEAISEIDVTSQKETIAKVNKAIDETSEMKKTAGFQREVKLFVKQCAGPTKTPVKDFPQGSDLDLCLLGKTGHGKSSLANAFFGEDWSPASSGTSSGTSECQKKQCTVGGRTFCLVDTPGTMDTRHPKETLQEIGEAVAHMKSGYDAFLITLRWNTKMTGEEVMAIELMKKMFGLEVLMNYAVFVFTYGDTFITEQKRNQKKTSFKDYIGSQKGPLVKFLGECKKRYVLINNMEDDPGKRREQFINLVNILDEMKNKEKYSNKYFEEAKKFWEEEEKKGTTEEKQIVKNVGEQIAKSAVNDGAGCFPADATIKIDTGETIALSNLQIGQKVLVSLGKNGNGFSTVYMFGHLQGASVANFIKINTETHTITLSSGHYIYTKKNQRWVETAAEDVAAGDILLTEHEGVRKEEMVTRISKSFEKGLYAPFTMTGTIVVNGVLASCYVNCISPSWAHNLLWPVRTLYRLCPSLLALVCKSKTNGIPTWIQFLRGAFKI